MGTISAQQPTGGTISPSQLSYTSGDTVTFSLSLNSGYTLTNWKVTSNGFNYYTIDSTTVKSWATLYDTYQTSSGSQRLTIYGATDTITGITAELSNGGSNNSGSTTTSDIQLTTTSVTGATLSPLSLSGEIGDRMSITCTVQDGYIFQYWVNPADDWISNGENTDTYQTTSSGNVYTYTIKSAKTSDNGNYTVKVKSNSGSTTLTTYTITQPSNSTYATFSGDNTVTSGGSSRISATVIEGKELNYWTINDTLVQNNSSGTGIGYTYSTSSSGNTYYLDLNNITTTIVLDAYFKDSTIITPETPEVSIDESHYINLYKDAAATNLSYPRTKAGAITLEDGTNLEELLMQLKALL